MNANIHDNEIKIDGYDLYCQEHKRHAGSVHLYINNNMENRLLKNQDSLENESV